jgi:hypothetical protein
MRGGMWIGGMLVAGAAQASQLYVVATGGDVTVIDLATGSVSPMGSLGVGFDWGGAAYDATTDTLFFIGGRTYPTLYAMDPATGAVTTIGDHNLADAFALAADPSTGDLYALQSNGFSGLHRLNKRTGAATLVGDPGIGFGGADFTSNGMILAQASFGQSMYLVNPTNGNARYLGDIGYTPSDMGLAVDPDDGVAWTADLGGTIWNFSPRTLGYNVYQTGVGSLVAAAVIPDGVRSSLLRLEQTAGTCGFGNVELNVTRAGPRANVALAYSTGGVGEFTIPGGACANLRVPLANPRLATTLRADPTGEALLIRVLPAGACGAMVVAVDLDACVASLPIELR